MVSSLYVCDHTGDGVAEATIRVLPITAKPATFTHSDMLNCMQHRFRTLGQAVSAPQAPEEWR